MTKVKISQLCQDLEEDYVQDIDLDQSRIDDALLEAIARRTMEKVAAEEVPSRVQAKGGRTMKKRSMRVLAAAAALCLLSATAVAAGGGLEYFRQIFGDSVEVVEGEIWSPQITAQGEQYQMTLESMLSDGYKTDVIISLVGEEAPDWAREAMPFTVNAAGDEALLSVNGTVLRELTESNKWFYQLTIHSRQNLNGQPVVIAWADEPDLKIDTTINGQIGAKEVAIGATVNGYTIDTLQLSPLGMLIIGHEEAAQGALPSVPVSLELTSGKVREAISADLIAPLAPAEVEGATVQGGGGIIHGDPDDESLPLARYGQMVRNPDGLVVTSAEFGRLLDLNTVTAIVIDGKRYPLE